MDQASEMKLSEPLIDYLVSRKTKEGQSAFYDTQWQKRTLCLIVALMALTLVVTAWLFIGRFWTCSDGVFCFNRKNVELLGTFFLLLMAVAVLVYEVLLLWSVEQRQS